MSYQIIFSDGAQKNFVKLDKPVQLRAAAEIDKLAETPRPADVVAVRGIPGVLRVRVGDYRVLYRVDDDKQEVWIEDVRHRSKVYGGH